jgi:hypothetical protein
MRLCSAFCSRVSVRRESRALQTPQRRASHSEAATAIAGVCSHGPVGRPLAAVVRILTRPATGRWLQGKERTR